MMTNAIDQFQVLKTWLMNARLTLEDVGDQFNISREQVRLIIAKTINPHDKQTRRDLSAALNRLADEIARLRCTDEPA